MESGSVVLVLGILPTPSAKGTTNLRVILFGKTGAGKSATANTILGGPYFSTSSSSSSITKRCSSESATRFGRKIQVIDTPGLFDTSLSREEVEEELLKCIAMSSPGPHAFILVLNIARFTKEEEETAMRFSELFENAVFDFFIVLFTRLDDLEYEGKALADHLQTAPANLKSILTKCSGRCIAFNNRGNDVIKDQLVRELLKIIDENMLERETEHYTDEMFQEAERLLQAKEEEVRRVLEHQKEKKYESLRREIEAKYKQEQEKLRSRIEKINVNYRKTEDRIVSRSAEVEEYVKKIKEEKVMMENEATEIERKRNSHLQELQNKRLEDKVLEMLPRWKLIKQVGVDFLKSLNLFKKGFVKPKFKSIF